MLKVVQVAKRATGLCGKCPRTRAGGKYRRMEGERKKVTAFGGVFEGKDGGRGGEAVMVGKVHHFYKHRCSAVAPQVCSILGNTESPQGIDTRCHLIQEKYIGTLDININYSLYKLALLVIKLLQNWSAIATVQRKCTKIAQLANHLSARGREGEREGGC